MRDRTVAIFVEQAESFLELGDLIIGELISHCSFSFFTKIAFFLFLSLRFSLENEEGRGASLCICDQLRPKELFYTLNRIVFNLHLALHFIIYVPFPPSFFYFFALYILFSLPFFYFYQMTKNYIFIFITCVIFFSRYKFNYLEYTLKNNV